MNKYPNETIKCLYERASVRLFEDRAIEPNVLKTIIDAGCHGATGGNLQPYSIIKIESPEKKKALMDTGCMQNIVEKAPVNLLFCIDWHRIQRWAQDNKAPFMANKSYRHFWIAFQDTIIAAQNTCTAADAMGLGSVYIGTVESCFDEIKDIFKIPNGVFPVVILSLGYPVETPAPAPKLMSDVIVHNEEYIEMPIDKLNSAMNEKYKDRTQTPLSEKNMETLFRTTEKAHGPAYANEVLDHAKSLGYINVAQRYFGLHYRADWCATGNSAFLKSIENYGFDWVKGIDFPILLGDI